MEVARAVLLSYNPTPQTPLGLTARVAPSWGGQATSGAEALWGRETMAGMAHGSFANGNRLDTPAGRGARTYTLRRNGETQTLVEGRRDMHFKHHLSIKGTEVPPR